MRSSWARDCNGFRYQCPAVVGETTIARAIGNGAREETLPGSLLTGGAAVDAFARRQEALAAPETSAVVENLVDNPTVHIGQSEVPSGMPPGQPFVIESHQMEDRRMQVVDVDRVVLGIPAELVG